MPRSRSRRSAHRSPRAAQSRARAIRSPLRTSPPSRVWNLRRRGRRPAGVSCVRRGRGIAAPALAVRGPLPQGGKTVSAHLLAALAAAASTDACGRQTPGALMRPWSRGIYADDSDRTRREELRRRFSGGARAWPRRRAGVGAAPCSTRPRPPSTGTAHAPAMKDDGRAGSIHVSVDAVLRRRVSAAEPCRPDARCGQRAASARKMPRRRPGPRRRCFVAATRISSPPN